MINVYSCVTFYNNTQHTKHINVRNENLWQQIKKKTNLSYK